MDNIPLCEKEFYGRFCNEIFVDGLLRFFGSPRNPNERLCCHGIFEYSMKVGYM